MTAASNSIHRASAPSPLFWLIVALAAGIITLALVAVNHADLRHGAEAAAARDCAERPGTIMFYNPATGRTALVCLTLEGKFGVVVMNELGKEVTAFVKNKLKTLEQVIQYLKNAGYGLIE